MLAWLVGSHLIYYEYTKRLSESYYTHWIYWGGMFTQNLVFLILNYKYYEWHIWIASIVTLILSGTLVVMMFITKRRTANNPRPDDLDSAIRRRSMKKGLLFQEFQDAFDQDSEVTGADYLEVKMSRKFIEQAEPSADLINTTAGQINHISHGC